MKPRIHKRHGIWSCVTRHPWPIVFVIGCGYSVKDAYAEWVRIMAEKAVSTAG